MWFKSGDSPLRTRLMPMSYGRGDPRSAGFAFRLRGWRGLSVRRIKIAFQTPDDQTKSRCHRNYQWVIVIWIEWFMTIYGSWANTTWSCFTDSCLTPVGARRRSIRYVSARSSFLKDVRPSQPRRSLRAHMDPVKNRHEAKNQPLNRKLGMKLFQTDLSDAILNPNFTPSIDGIHHQHIGIVCYCLTKISWLVVWNIFPYIENTHPNWLSFFSQG